ncbi:MAG: hypothetical protein JW727_00090 [Candidatus Aenigmarchaeota archaeon]|nr:hypothetical protein [Candidatus Aenigmarchaeota archaeon]
MRYLATLSLLALLVLCPVSAFSIGTAPGVQYVGEFSPGENTYVKFYLLTNAQGDILTTLSYMRPHLELYYPGKLRYISAYEASQQDITGWIAFQQNPVLVSPRKSIIATLQGGEVVKANAEVVFKLSIPKNAEPGYHVGSVSLAPKVVTTGGGTGVSTLGITRYVFIFKVRGPAERSGEVKTMYGDRVDESRARVDVLFKNTGKDTLSVWVESLNIYDDYGNTVANLESGLVYVPPGETKILPVYWSNRNASGVYQAEVKTNYITGFATKTVSIEIPIQPSMPVPESPKFQIPWWLILLVILLIILIIYWKY